VGTGIVGAPACGDVMKLQIKCENVDDKNVIVDAKFKTYGCGSAIASSGQLIDMLKGKTLEEAQKISNQEIVDILELPAIKIHCSVLAEEAIHRAIDDFKSRRNND
jgi:nitrogen fixation NifU-like protein